MHYYFAYGANVNPEVLRERGIRFSDRRHAVLRGYELRFNKRAQKYALPERVGFANINRSPGGRVEGILYAIEERDLVLLDEHERVPDHYRRVTLQVECGSSLLTSAAYEAHPERIAEGLIPPREYVEHILCGEDLFTEGYCTSLRSLELYHRSSE